MKSEARSRVAGAVALMLCLMLLMATGHTGLAKGKPPKDNDTTPPDAISDLSATSSGVGAIRLRFTSVGDDGGGAGCAGVGVASEYDIRYDTAPIESDADFAAAAEAEDEPNPNNCGVVQRYCLAGLEADVLYYVAMRVIDDAGNVSALSNLASAVSGFMLGAEVHVHDVLVQWSPQGRSRLRWAVVQIRDEYDVPVEGAVVGGEWSGDIRGGTSSGVSDACGFATLDGGKVQCQGGGLMVFTVTSVAHPAAAYEPGANVETTASAWCN